MIARNTSSNGKKAKYSDEFMRRAALERMEDELDLKARHEAKAEFDADPVACHADEIAKKYL